MDEKCNLKDAAEKIAWGKFINNGQTCLAPDYVIVHENVVDSFLQLLSNQVSLLFKDNGGSYKTSNAYGRLVNRNHFNRITNLMQEAIDKGAKVVISGEFDEAENYVAPVILRDIDPSSKVMEEEIFGPILPILTYSDLQEVTDLINSKTNPLVLYYFGNSKKNYKRLLNETSSGNVCINDCLVHFGHTNLPFGGVNHSGMGKAHGKYGFMEFSNAKGVLKQRVGITATKFIFPPYTSITKRIIILLKKYL